jgi:glycerophosphoryl diester phosphodiesterase
MNKVKNFAHRGYSGNYPENTMLAFQKAIEVGADGIENDVHLTKDGVLVIIHDEKVDRTTNGTGYVKDMTYAELQELDASYLFPQYGQQKIPTLREYLELVKDEDIITNIELKTGVFEYPGIEEKVYEMLKEYDLADRIIISSFNHYSVMRMKEIAPEIKCGLLEESWLLNAGEYVAKSGVECFHPFYKNMTKELAAEVKSHGLEINTWTANEEDEILELIRNGVDGIISNEPELVKKVIAFYANF